MLIDGLNILEGSVISNLTVASGTSFPSNAAAGELFFRTDLNALHVFNNSAWVKTIDSASGFLAANTAITAGTNTKITYDANGLVTAGSSPTTLAGYGITDAAAIGGSTSQTFSASTVSASGSLLPTITSTQDIGSTSLRWRAIYVDDLHLSTNTLYLGDTPVLGTNMNTIEIKADLDQSMVIKTTGVGQTQIQSAGMVHISTASASADILINSAGTGAMTRFQSSTEVRATAPVISLVGDTTVTGAFTVSSGLTVNGALNSINSTNLAIKDNVVLVNAGEAGNGVTGTYAGLQFDRGGFADWQLVFDESDDTIKYGAIGSLVTVASTTDLAAKASLSGASFSGNIVVQTGAHITLTDAPVSGTDAVNKTYVDNNLAGLTWKNSVKVATTANITLSGTQTIDGVAVVAGNRVLVKDQTNQAENGVYLVDVGPWVRTADMDGTTPLNEFNSAAVFVELGTANIDTGWTQINDVTVIGTSPVAFAQFNGAAGITAGTGLVKSGNTLNINMGAGIAQLPTDEVGVDVYNGGGLMVTEDGINISQQTGAQLSLTRQGTAGTYKSVTVDAYGRITAGTNPTTLAGYGITDASATGATFYIGTTAIANNAGSGTISSLAGLTTVTATTFSGNATTATTATNATNVALADAANTAASFYIPFASTATGNNALKTDAGITYDPSTNTLTTIASSAQYADLAEKYVADAEYAPGTVLAFGGDKEVTVSSANGDRKVIGVVTTNPAYLMNDGLVSEFVAAIALQGRVPCKVTGNVAKGDMMVSNGDGTARAEADPKVGSVIGKALENFVGTTGTIEVLVGKV